MTVSLTFALTLTAANVIRVMLEFTVNDEVTNENVVLPLSAKFKAIKTNTKRDSFVLMELWCSATLFCVCVCVLCYVILCNVMSCNVNRHSCNIISRYVMLC